MRSALLVLLLAFTTGASAHFEIGTYKGTLESGDACSFEIKSVRFENSLMHPLNERVLVDVRFINQQIEMSHLAVVDAAVGTARPKDHVLSFVAPFTGGAEAVELMMNHDGPTQLVVMRDHYRQPENNRRTVCSNLTFEE